MPASFRSVDHDDYSINRYALQWLFARAGHRFRRETLHLRQHIYIKGDTVQGLHQILMPQVIYLCSETACGAGERQQQPIHTEARPGQDLTRIPEHWQEPWSQAIYCLLPALAGRHTRIP